MLDTPESTPPASQSLPASPESVPPISLTPEVAAPAPAPAFTPAPSPVPAAAPAPMRPPVATAPRPIAPTGIAKAPGPVKFVSPMPKIEESENAIPAVFTVIAGAAAVVTLAFTVLLYLKR